MLYTPAKNLSIRSQSDSSDSVELAAFSRYLYRRRNVTIIAAIVGVALAATISVFLPRKYTATASILIESPAGNDPRGATAVSPVYLESLKTYEHFASSDSLFQQALEHLGLRNGYAGVPIEALKRQVLKVVKPRDTKILEISATLGNPVKAQQFAQYVAERAVAMNRSLESTSNHELGGEAQVLVQAARTRLDTAKQVRDTYAAHEPIAGLQAELAGATDLKSRVDRDLVDAHVELAAYQARSQSKAAEKVQTADASLRDEIAAVQAEIGSLERQSQSLIHTVDADSALLERRKHQQEMLDKELQIAQSEYEAAMNRNTEILASASFRGERLEIVDPGVVPEQPSSPNVPLNLFVALAASLISSVLYLAICFGQSRIPSMDERDEGER